MSADRQLAALMAKYTKAVQAVARSALDKLRAQVPGAVELVYDNYNALVIALGPTDKASQLVCSIALYPRWVNLFFAHGATLPDPKQLLRGAGVRVRSIQIDDPDQLDAPAVRALVKQAFQRADAKIEPGATRRIEIRSVSAKQRPRTPPKGPE